MSTATEKPRTTELSFDVDGDLLPAAHLDQLLRMVAFEEAQYIGLTTREHASGWVLNISFRNPPSEWDCCQVRKLVWPYLRDAFNS